MTGDQTLENRSPPTLGNCNAKMKTPHKTLKLSSWQLAPQPHLPFIITRSNMKLALASATFTKRLPFFPFFLLPK
jgi:hypothetical protein